jgi:hypothetical protein
MYRYGIQRTRGGKVTTYVCRDSNGVSSDERYPEKDGGVVIKEEIDECSAQVAYERANEMMTRELSPGMYSVQAGDVAHHSDSEGSHQAIVLGDDGSDDYVRAVFFTSSPGFGVRRASIEELGCAGFGYSRETYLAPVIRPRSEFMAEGIKFPKYRVLELEREFFMR